MLAYLKIYFGDPDEKSTARHDLDHLVQVRRVEEYVTAFQSIAYKTEYSEAELEHRFIVGLKQEIRDKCLAAYPRPEGLGEWISRAYALQHCFRPQLLTIVEGHNHPTLIEEECQEDLLLRHKRDIHTEGCIIHPITNKSQLSSSCLHNLSHRLIHNQHRELIEVE